LTSAAAGDDDERYCCAFRYLRSLPLLQDDAWLEVLVAAANLTAAQKAGFGLVVEAQVNA
jgi:hypothetical protein